MTATIIHQPGGLPVVKAPLAEWQNAGRYTWIRNHDPLHPFQIAYQSMSEAEVTAWAINSARLNQPKHQVVA